MKYPVYLVPGDTITTTISGFEFHSKPITSSIQINNEWELINIIKYKEEHEIEMLRTVYNLNNSKEKLNG